MTEFNWCHGPECHKRHTTGRIRGVKGNKVLRTRKITKASQYNQSAWGQYIHHYFCDDTCMRDYIVKHLREIVTLEPRHEPLETPIEVTKETVSGYYGNRVETTITERGAN